MAYYPKLLVFSFTKKKVGRANFFPGDLVLELEPYHKTDTTGTTGARGVWRRHARARVRWCGASVNQPTMEKSQCLNSLDFSRGWQAARGGRQCATGMPRRRRRCRPTARRRLLAVLWWPALVSFVSALLKLIEFKQRKQRRLSSLLKKNVSFYYNIVLSTVCHVIWLLSLWRFFCSIRVNPLIYENMEKVLEFDMV